jgi:N-methylhydantoinase A/oxoprolinase/acetone carboxylase beta subunit
MKPDRTCATERQCLRLGIDVGGTNTDAVLMQGRTILATNKSFTSSDVTSGVIESVTRLLEASALPPGAVGQVMIGTTQFINAFVQRRDLASVAVVRAALPRGDGVPSLVTWPADLLSVIGRHAYEVHGGAGYNGSCYAEIDKAEVRRVAQDIRRLGISSIAVSATYAPLRPDIEAQVERILLESCPDASVTQSAAVGGLGLVDRENAAIINASLAPLAQRVVTGLKLAFSELGIRAPIYISQNDGTLISTAEAARHPVFNCAAGPTNSIRGAAFLSGLTDAVVIDVGGTTTDVGFVSMGFPKESALPHLIGGVRTNMRMPDVLSIALGGGTRIAFEGTIKLGPLSVGHRLSTEALVFGGETLTASDVAVAAGAARLGDPRRVAHLHRALVEGAMARMAQITEETIDRVKTSGAAAPAVLVGGGSILLPGALRGTSQVVRPPHAAVANAVGAAIATVSGRVDKMYDIATLGRDAALAQARSEAIQSAIAAGADPTTIEIVEITELPMTHIRANATQIKVRAVGELGWTNGAPASLEA